MNNIALIVYGRFPTEKAYGSHIIDVASGFLKNGLIVDVIYSETYNSKTIYQEPAKYYKNNGRLEAGWQYKRDQLRLMVE